MKNIEQIESEIQKLHEIRPHVRRITAFGQDNHAAINAQIVALGAVIQIANLDELDSLPDARELLGGDFEEMSSHAREAAQEALDWASDYGSAASLVDDDGWASIAK